MLPFVSLINGVCIQNLLRFTCPLCIFFQHNPQKKYHRVDKQGIAHSSSLFVRRTRSEISICSRGSENLEYIELFPFDSAPKITLGVFGIYLPL